MNVEINIEKTGLLTFDLTEEQITRMLTSAFEACLHNEHHNECKFNEDAADKCNDDKKQSTENSEEGYKGFLLIECPKCGKVRAFCTKAPISASYCRCGYEIKLKDLSEAMLDCQCGQRWKYMTNIRSYKFAINCLSCNSPIHAVYNHTSNRYESMR